MATAKAKPNAGHLDQLIVLAGDANVVRSVNVVGHTRHKTDAPAAPAAKPVKVTEPAVAKQPVKPKPPVRPAQVEPKKSTDV